MADLKQQAKEIFLTTLEMIEVKAVFDRKIRVGGDMLFAGEYVIDLNRYEEVVAIGLGKASLRMGMALDEALGDRLTRGVLVTSAQPNVVPSPRFETVVGGHPLPTEGSLWAGQRLLEMAATCGPKSLVIFLISGGGSALAESPASANVSLEDLKELNRILIGCGATIEEINMIRKAISRIKGGRLGHCVASTGAQSLAIYVSDVNPGDLRSIASNPVLPEPPGRDEALKIVAGYDLEGRLPSSVLRALESGAAEDDSGARQHSLLRTVLLCDNRFAIEAASNVAGSLGFLVHTCYDLTEGDYRDVAGEMIERLSGLRNQFSDRAICIISGGEVSCVVSGSGVGGRNQEFVLYSATKLAEQCVGTGPLAVLSCGTDGIDGNSSAAGAVSDRECIEEAIRSGIDPRVYLRENDSFSFFSKMGGLVSTGPTGTNVRDIRMMLSSPNK
jgi:glycerate-2-kinase